MSSVVATRHRLKTVIIHEYIKLPARSHIAESYHVLDVRANMKTGRVGLLGHQLKSTTGEKSIWLQTQKQSRDT